MKKGARNCSKAAAPLLSAGPIRVTGMDAGGAGLIRLPDGLEVIVPGALPGDEITLAYRPPQPGGRRVRRRGRLRGKDGRGRRSSGRFRCRLRLLRRRKPQSPRQRPQLLHLPGIG